MSNLIVTPCLLIATFEIDTTILILRMKTPRSRGIEDFYFRGHFREWESRDLPSNLGLSNPKAQVLFIIPLPPLRLGTDHAPPWRWAAAARAAGLTSAHSRAYPGQGD